METVRSLTSTHSVSATFRNISERTAELYWVDFRGKLVLYCGEICPGKAYHIMTYVTHPWVARDRATGQWLAVGGGSVYVTPMPTNNDANEQGEAENEEEDMEGPVEAGSLEIIIHLPVYRLEDICIGFLRKHLQNRKLTTEHLSTHLLNKISTIPTLSARVYHPHQGIRDQ